jgi:4-hydroxybenzoate polyprenyltransferase
LGAAFGWAIPMAYAAVTNTVPPIAWLLFLANVLWSVIYDTQYAMVDREDDRKIGVKSTAFLFGDRDKGNHRLSATGLAGLADPGRAHSTGAAGFII